MISVYNIKRMPLVEIILDSFGSDCVFSSWTKVPGTAKNNNTQRSTKDEEEEDKSRLYEIGKGTTRWWAESSELCQCFLISTAALGCHWPTFSIRASESPEWAFYLRLLFCSCVFLLFKLPFYLLIKRHNHISCSWSWCVASRPLNQTC